MLANVQVVQPLRQRSAGPLGCSWGAQAERTPLVSLCVVLVSLFTMCTCILTDTYFAVAVLIRLVHDNNERAICWSQRDCQA